MMNWTVAIAPDVLKSRLQTGMTHYTTNSLGKENNGKYSDGAELFYKRNLFEHAMSNLNCKKKNSESFLVSFCY